MRNLPILLILLLVFQTNVFSQDDKTEDQNDVISVETNLVMIPATVYDREGRYATNLKKEDFQVFEDGVEQEIELFETVDKPFTIMFLLDKGSSMSKNLAESVRAANLFFTQLRPADELIAAAFAENIELLFPVTKVDAVKKGIRIRQNRFESQTYTFYAVDYAIKKLRKIKGRKAIILFSDGLGVERYSSAQDNLRNAAENDILIYTIQFQTPSLVSPANAPKKVLERIDFANNYMRDLAQETGGRFFQVDDTTNLENAFKSVADELGRQYSLGYYPKRSADNAQNGLRSVTIKMRQPNLKGQARTSYLVK